MCYTCRPRSSLGVPQLECCLLWMDFAEFLSRMKSRANHAFLSPFGLFLFVPPNERPWAHDWCHSEEGNLMLRRISPPDKLTPAWKVRP